MEEFLYLEYVVCAYSKYSNILHYFGIVECHVDLYDMSDFLVSNKTPL